MPPHPLLSPQSIVHNLFNIHATATRLDGEYDANFRVEASDGARYLLRVSHAAELPETIDFQNALLGRLAQSPAASFVPHLVPNVYGATAYQAVIDGVQRWVRLFRWVDGRVLARTKPHLPELLLSFGHMLGTVDGALVGFDHPAAHRAHKWDLSTAEWIARDLALIDDPARRALVEQHLATYMRDVLPRLTHMRCSVIHNDANDYNVLVLGTGYDARVSGLIDFGDALHAPTVCNLAIALAYAMLDKPDPIASAAHVVGGYHHAFPLAEPEVALLFPLASMRLCVSVVNSARRKHESPDDPYVIISEAPAWRSLERLAGEHPRLAHYKFRHACGWEPVPHAPQVRAWLKAVAADAAPVVDVDVRTAPPAVFDLSVGSLDLGLPDEYNTTAKFTDLLFARMHAADVSVGIGRYDEPRLIYASEDFATTGEDGTEYRTVHIALDLFQPAGASVFAPLDGVVHSFADNTAQRDYGPCLILQHATGDGIPFYTLYGHLSRASLDGLRTGKPVQRGQHLGAIGDFPINGDWPPHLHFQVIVDLLNMGGTFPGVARPSDRAVWLSLCPDPNVLVGVPASAFPEAAKTAVQLLRARREYGGHNQSISYRTPIHMARACLQFMFDGNGRKYLDVYNNVPHVGHNHPHVVRAAQRQLAVLNTNTRYVQDQWARYAQRLTATLPAPLRVCYFVASGSEATELALRLARVHTGQRDLIVSDGAYHGHTSTLIDISPYKAEGPGGAGLPNWVHKADVPDVYRGKYRAASAGKLYARDVTTMIDHIRAQGRGLCGYIIESVPSVGGQIVLPDGYLPAVYAAVRASGGVCMADEVQTGFGRMGTHFWAFERYGVVPDIVALGKPIGNGYPMGAVITTSEIAAAFDNGMEFFSTFGGNTVACAVGNAVLDVIERERLQENARDVGDVFMAELRGLMTRYPIIGDVRGSGLMIGVELVNDCETLDPAAAQASYVANRMRECGVLIGTDGIFHNILKLRGPMCLRRDDVTHFIETLADVLAEDGALPK